MFGRGICDGKIEKMDTDTKKKKICKNCFHKCHCDGDLHADEYGVCTCEECKC